jgi:tetratricopeptide (TPR) repeat protein
MIRRALPLVAVIVFAGAAPPATADQGQAGSVDPRLQRVEQWLSAVLHHEPGLDDAATARIGAWPNADLRTLWLDVNVLVQMMRNPRGLSFSVQQEGQRRATPVRYTRDQFVRMRVLACAAAGTLTEPVCARSTAPNTSDGRLAGLLRLDRDLAELAHRVESSSTAGDHDNYILRRAALLHTDIAFIGRAPDEGVVSGGSALQGIRLDVSDGRGMGFAQSTVHWEIARQLLDFVIPAGEDRPAPSRDGMVRQWYHAVAAWRQSRETHDTRHLDLARQLFPDDADILFLSGCQHETYAGAPIQNAVRSSVLPTGFKLDIDADRAELRLAEGFFRRALAARPDFAEAHLRLGRVLLLRGRPAEASIELQQAIGSVKGDQLLYFAELFAGAAHEALSQFDAARASFEKAADLYPTAQSPLLALSALARRRGDRVAALRALRDLFELPSDESLEGEPWWLYTVAQARNADALLEELRKPFKEHTEAQRDE